MYLVYPLLQFPITIVSNIKFCPQLVAPEASRVLLKSSAVGMGGLRSWSRALRSYPYFYRLLSNYFRVSK